MSWLLVALGSAVGGVLRYGCGLLIPSQGLPWATILVNIAGSFAIGAVAASAAGVELKLFLMTGVLGGFTTFSAFSLQTLELAQAGDLLGAGLNVGLSVVLCLVAVWLGWLLVKA